VEWWHALEIWVRSHSRSLKMAHHSRELKVQLLGPRVLARHRALLYQARTRAALDVGRHSSSIREVTAKTERVSIVGRRAPRHLTLTCTDDGCVQRVEHTRSQPRWVPRNVIAECLKHLFCSGNAVGSAECRPRNCAWSLFPRLDDVGPGFHTFRTYWLDDGSL